MDIEALRKINELTKALQQHGISPTSEDAWKQAEMILQPQEPTAKATTTVQQNQDGDLLMERKYKLLLEMNNKKFETTITTMQDTLNMLTEEISRLKTEINNLSTQKNSTETTTKQESSIQTKQTTNEEPKKEAHPRQGSFAPGDISIEKMFYYGHK